MPAPGQGVRSRAGIVIAAILAPLALALWLPGRAGAAIQLPHIVDGPGNAILGVDGTALASDGSGGIVYRKQVDGVVHVFAVLRSRGAWSTPIEVDPGDPYGAQQPAIAAGNGGRLLAVWVQPRGVSASGVTQYELMSASLGPGARTFAPAVMVDASVGEPYSGDVSGVQPRLAMASNGQADVVYRVVTDSCSIAFDTTNPLNGQCPPQAGTGAASREVVEVRAARFGFGPWSSLGVINRAPQLAMATPSVSNAPALALASGGTGLVVWQEPDSSGVLRIFARRLFGGTISNPIEVSPTSIGGVAVSADADAPAASINAAGRGEAAFRLQGGPGSPLGSAHLFAGVVRGTEAAQQPATDLGGAATAGPPGVAIAQGGDARVAGTLASTALLDRVSGGTVVVGGPETLGAATSGAGVWTSAAPDGGGVAAWAASSPSGLPVVAMREDFPDGSFQAASLAGDLAGQISGLSAGTGTTGDELVGWMEGAPGYSEVVAAYADARPGSFTVSGPGGWQRPRGAEISWDPSPAAGPVGYVVYVDGRPRAQVLDGPTATDPSTNPNLGSLPVAQSGEATTITCPLAPLRLGDGKHAVQVLAADGQGNATLSSPQQVRIDAAPPIVRLARTAGGRGIVVRISDAESGVAPGAVTLAFGDGRHARGHVRVLHVYARPGLYTLVARVADRVGNRATVRLRVRVR